MLKNRNRISKNYFLNKIIILVILILIFLSIYPFLIGFGCGSINQDRKIILCELDDKIGTFLFLPISLYNNFILDNTFLRITSFILVELVWFYILAFGINYIVNQLI
jgi:hypothetical protein